MALQQQIGIKISLDSSSVTSGTQQAARSLAQLGTAAKGAGEVSTKAMGNLSAGLNDVARRVEILAALTATVHGLGAAIVALPRNAFDYSKNLETTQVGMAGVLGSMTAINGQQLQFNAALAISRDMIRKLNDDAMRTAASSQELTSTFQALLAPGLAARMTLQEIRELTVVGTNAVKSMGIAGNQVVQELRDLVSGGITASGSQLASALGLKDEDIAKARASSEGLFAFLMERLKGFKDSADYFGNTLQGRLDTLQEGAVRVVAAGMEPLTEAVKKAAGEAAALFGVFEEGQDAKLNPALVESLTEFSEAVVVNSERAKRMIGVVWDHREAIIGLVAAYQAFSLAQRITGVVEAIKTQQALSQASRLAAMEAAVEAAANSTVTASSRQKVAAYLAELQAKATNTQATAAATEAELLSLNAERNAIAIKQASATAAFEQARASMVAARSAGALSFALAATREASDALNAAQARRAAVGTELAGLTARQAQVEAALTAATAAHTAASNAAAVASTGLAAATGTASVAARGFSMVVGALGGPVGIGILAITSLAMWLWNTKSAANEAEKALFHLNRAKDDAAAGKPVQERDLVSVRAGLQQAQEELDALEQRAKNIAPNKTAQDRYNAQVDKAKSKVAEYTGLIESAQAANARAAQSTTGLSLTLSGTEQAWNRANEGVKTGSAAQDEYRQKLSASRRAFEDYKQRLVESGADAAKIADVTRRQAENEKALADERDKKIKEMGSSAAAAQGHAIEAQRAALQQGYKLLAQQTADGLDEIDSLRKQDVISEYAYVQRKRDLALQDLADKEESLRAELALLRGKKDSAKEQATLEGQLAELQQQRINLQNKAARDLQELLVKPQNYLLNSTRQATQGIYEQAAALEAQNSVYGQGATALTGLTIAQLEKTRADLEATENVIPGYVDQIERQIAALKRLQAAQTGAASLDAGKKAAEEAARASERIAEQAIRQNEQIAQSLADNLMRGGKSAAAYLKDLFRTLVLRPVLQLVISPITGAVSGVINQLLGGSGSGAGVLNGAGLIGQAGGLLGGTALGTASTSALATAQGWLGMTGTAAQASTAAANGVAYAATGSGSMAATIGSYAPYAAAAILAYQMLKSLNGGETRTGGQYAVAYDGEVHNNRRGETYRYERQQYNRDNSLNPDGTRTGVTNGQAYLIEADGMGTSRVEVDGVRMTAEEATRKAVAATASSIDETLKALGSSAHLTGYWAGLETSGRGRGGVFAGGSLSNGTRFGESGEGNNYAGTLYERWSTHSPNSEQAMAEFTLDLKQSYLQALQAVEDIPQSVKKLVKDKNVEEMSAQAVDALMGQIQAQITAVQQFGQVVDALPMAALRALSFDASAGLLELAGGLDKLGQSLQGYLANYYSLEERQDQARKNITAGLAEVGLEMPKTREEFRALVEAQDLETEAGRKAWTALMAVQGAFAELTPSADELAKAAADQAKAQQEAAQAQAEAARKALQSATDTAYEALKRSTEAQRQLLEAAQQAAQAVVSDLQGVFDALKSAVQGLYLESAHTVSMGAAQGRAVIDQALATGVLPSQAALNEAIAAARAGLTRANYESLQAMDTDRLVLAGKLAELQGLAGTQLSAAELQLQAAQREVDLLDQLLNEQALQLNALRGIDTSVVSVSEAVSRLAAALKEERQGNAAAVKPGVDVVGQGPGGFSVGGGGTSPSPTPVDSGFGGANGRYWGWANLGSYGYAGYEVTDPDQVARYDSIWNYLQSDFGTGSKEDLERIADVAHQFDVSQADIATASGFTPEQIRDMFSGAGIASFAVGTDYVPRNMLALIHQGERIVPSSYNRSDETNADIVSVLRQLLGTLQQVVLGTSSTADVLTSASRGGFLAMKQI